MMNHQKQKVLISEQNLSSDEKKKREGLVQKNPYVAKKLANISKMEEKGEVSPIIRLEKSYLCNFQCTHCSAEYYMDRHLEKVLKTKEDRTQMTLDDVRNISKQADELGLARFVITGGEPLVMKDFDAVVEAIDPKKHYIISDTNGDGLSPSYGNCIMYAGGIPGDVSGDNIVNILDIVQMVNMVLGTMDSVPGADLNGDGTINILDIVLVINIILEN